MKLLKDHNCAHDESYDISEIYDRNTGMLKDVHAHCSTCGKRNTTLEQFRLQNMVNQINEFKNFIYFAGRPDLIN